MATLRLAAKQTYQGQQMRTIFYVAGGDATHTNGQVIVDYMRSIWNTHLKALLHATWKLEGVDVKDVTDPGNPTIPYAFTSGVLAGTSSGDIQVAQVAILCTLKALAAPPNISRKFLCGFTEDAFVAGLVAGTIVTSVNAWAGAWLGIAAATSLALAPTATRVTPEGVLVGSNPVTFAVTSNIPATQRRRRIGVGI